MSAQAISTRATGFFQRIAAREEFEAASDESAIAIEFGVNSIALLRFGFSAWG